MATPPQSAHHPEPTMPAPVAAATSCGALMRALSTWSATRCLRVTLCAIPDQMPSRSLCVATPKASRTFAVSPVAPSPPSPFLAPSLTAPPVRDARAPPRSIPTSLFLRTACVDSPRRSRSPATSARS
eukprot:scaffold35436_cov66-Phaeocystis_antarctica.AAC.1